MYHAVEDRLREPRYKHFYVTKSEFDWQMGSLRRQGYSPIDFRTLFEAMAGRGELPSKPIILTFDDGYANLLDNVAPVLAGLHWPYTVFLVSERVGMTNEWVIPEGYEPTPLLTWEQIREMARTGDVDFQPHTATHPHLDQIPISAAADEMARSRALLQDTLQREATVLCYPYGHFSPDVISAARDCGYTMAVTTEFGRVRAADDPMHLPRISVYHVPAVSLTYGIGTMNFGWRVRSRKDTRPTPAGKNP